MQNGMRRFMTQVSHDVCVKVDVNASVGFGLDVECATPLSLGSTPGDKTLIVKSRLKNVNRNRLLIGLQTQR